MKSKLLSLLPYVLALCMDFYLLPLLMRDTGGAMFLMLCVMPLAAFLVGVACGVRRGFRLALPAAALVLFLPALPLYYNYTAWVYAPVYALIVLAGNGLGRVLYYFRT